MPADVAYATQAEFEAYVEGWTTTDQDALERALERAQQDIDDLAGPWSVEDDGRKFGAPRTTNAKGLDAAQRAVLSRATCAAAEYRLTVGEPNMVQAQPESVSGPDFSITRGSSNAAAIGAKVARELRTMRELGLVITGARARPGGGYYAGLPRA